VIFHPLAREQKKVATNVIAELTARDRCSDEQDS